MITTAQVANASQLELLCLTYEIFLDDMKQALQSENRERKTYIDHGKEVLKQLAEGLNFEVEISQNLFKLYIYMQNLLINHWKEDCRIEEVYQLMHTVYAGYEKLLKENVEKKPVMNNIENIYAGMTYGKGYLQEIVVGNEQRGFKA